MKIIDLVKYLCIIVLGCGSICLGGERRQSEKKKADTHVLLIRGIIKDQQEKTAKDKVFADLQHFFTVQLRVKPKTLVVLVDEAEGARTSSRQNLKASIEKLARTIKAADTFIFYYLGQANITAGKLRLNLPGPDAIHEELGEWINKIKADSMLLVLDCPGAGLAIKSLTGKGRIVLCAARSDQPYSTRFSEYFLPALTNKENDTDADGAVSLLEAFRRTAEQIDDYYRKQNLLGTEIPLLEDDDDGIPSQQPWRYKEKKKDGKAASMVFLAQDAGGSDYEDPNQ